MMASAEKFDLLKAHIDQYTRKDGTVVQAHEDKRISSDKAFDKIVLSGGHNASTTSSHINYYHHGVKKQLAHKEHKDGTRYVNADELDQHLSALSGGK